MIPMLGTEVDELTKRYQDDLLEDEIYEVILASTPAEVALIRMDEILGIKPTVCVCGEGGGWSATHSKWCGKFQQFKTESLGPPTYETMSDAAPKGMLRGEIIHWMGAAYVLGTRGFEPRAPWIEVPVDESDDPWED